MCVCVRACVCFRDFLLGSFAFDESVALDLLAEYGLTTLLLDFAMVSLCWMLGSLLARLQAHLANGGITERRECQIIIAKLFQDQLIVWLVASLVGCLLACWGWFYLHDKLTRHIMYVSQ